MVKARRMSPRKSPISPKKARRALKRQESVAKSPEAKFPVGSPKSGTD